MTRPLDNAMHIAHHLADPDTVTGQGHPHSLADGAAGISVLYSTLSTIDPKWRRSAHAWIKHALACSVTINHRDGLFHGVPALAYGLHLAAAHNPDYLNLLVDLDEPLERVTRAKLDAAHQRLARGVQCGYGEYDLINGLTGIAALLLAIRPSSSLLRDVLSYLVALTQPVIHDGREWPGWWVHHGPNPAHTHVIGGHGNLGLAHGITGPLTVLAMAHQHGIRVSGHRDAITAVLTWLDTWHHATTGLWWPPAVTADQHRHPDIACFTPERASWCYGTPGIATALHRTAKALGDTVLAEAAQAAMLASLTDTDQHPAGPGLCHGTHGLTAVAHAITVDANPRTREAILERARAITHSPEISDEPGLLTGTIGAALAALASELDPPPPLAWNRFLLLV